MFPCYFGDSFCVAYWYEMIYGNVKQMYDSVG